MSRLFFDTDLFVLLAGGGLLESLVRSVGFSMEATRRLQPLPHMLRGSRFKKKYPRGLRERAAACCDLVRPIEDAPDVGVEEMLMDTTDLDPGELQLFAAAARIEGSVVATGDKRACRALAGADLGHRRGLLGGKILCLESALMALLGETSFEALTRDLSPLREFNRTLRVLLPQSERTSEQSFREGLQSYERDVREILAELCWSPER